MKRTLIVLTLLLATGTCLVAMNKPVGEQRRELEGEQTRWQAQTQQLAEIHAEAAALKAKISDQEQELRGPATAAPLDPELAAFLLTNDVRFASAEIQDRLLAGFGRGKNSSDAYVLVSKAALAGTNVRPLKSYPHGTNLTDQVCGLLVITPEEQRALEAIFAEAFSTIETWARENVRRDGPISNMLARYAIPADREFREAFEKDLYANINSAVGAERGEMLRKDFEMNGIYEDGAIGGRTNILSIHRITEAPGYGFRSGWRLDRSEAINTCPEPIKPRNFPVVFRFIFPGGWPEVGPTGRFLNCRRSLAGTKRPRVPPGSCRRSSKTTRPCGRRGRWSPAPKSRSGCSRQFHCQFPRPG